MPQGPKDRLPQANGRLLLFTRRTYEKLQAILAGLETVFSSKDFEWEETPQGKRVRIKKRTNRTRKKYLPFEVILIVEPPAIPGGDPTYKVSVAHGRVNERRPDDTEALRALVPDNYLDPVDPSKLAEFSIAMKEAVYVRVDIDEDGGVEAGGASVKIVVDADNLPSMHYEPKVDDETPAGVAGLSYYYKLAVLKDGDAPGDPPKLEPFLTGSHLSHWRDLPSFRNVSNDAGQTGLVFKNWDATLAAYQARPISREFGKLTIFTNTDEIVARGTKKDGEVQVFYGDVSAFDDFMNWSDGLMMTGVEINGDEQPLPDPEQLRLFLADVIERAPNPDPAQIRVFQVGAIGRVFQVEGNGKKANLTINGENKLSWIDGLITNAVDVEIDALPSGSEGDMLYHDGTEWVVLPAPGVAVNEGWVLVHNGNNPEWLDTTVTL